MRRAFIDHDPAGRRDDPGGCAVLFVRAVGASGAEQTGLEKLELLVVTGEALKPNLVAADGSGNIPESGWPMLTARPRHRRASPATDGAGSGKSHVACRKPGTEHDDLHCR
ncbi:hypothetical protein P7H19_12815 [Paenibacillus larvae]|nr:hypothetical protein [Paenibacillus larvae]MDT2237003.1 hypothetical protein [Paenibacillus larvae]